jgi:hypothetical protein
MPWGKLDDSLYDHPKLDGLGRRRMACLGLWTAAISWSNRRLTDGYIPTERVRLLGGTLAQATALVHVRLFDEVVDGFQVHDYLDFNDSRDEILARRAAAAERQRKARESQQQSHSDSHRDRDGSHTSRADAGAGAFPSRPVPSPVTRTSNGSQRLNTPRATNGEPLLTKAQLEAWATFGPEWGTFKAAWLARGFLFPPFGSPDDDDTSQRGLLWSLLDARPTDLVRWVQEAPGKFPTDVLGYILGHWHTIRDEAEATEPSVVLHGPNRRDAAERLGSIMERVLPRRPESVA